MLDRYWWGTVRRISPEAPVPVLNLQKATVALGGAANVAANVAGLKAQPILISAVGNDEAGKTLKNELKNKNIDSKLIVSSNKIRTTVKTRIVAHSQHIVRIDEEQNEAISKTIEDDLLVKIESVLDECEVIILSDYNKGVLTEKILTRLITSKVGGNKIILVDPKGESFEKYKGASLLTPNFSEFQTAISRQGITESELSKAGNELREINELDSLLITQGENGMLLLEKNKKPQKIEAETKQVFDVTGAGDTVIAAMAAGLGAKVKLKDCADFANYCAGLVIQQVGTTAINLEMLNG